MSAYSAAELTNIVSDVDVVLLRIILWEVIITFDFDFSVLCGWYPFKPPIVLYWLTRYGTFCFVIVVCATEFGRPLNCQIAGDFINLASGIAMAGTSSLLMLWAIALWGRDRRIAVPLIAAHLGQWGISIRNGFLAKEHWDDTEMGCVIDSVTWPAMKLSWVYTMVFDFIVLVVASWALLRVAGRSSLVQLLFLDGLAYFAVAFGLYLACTLVAYLSESILLTFIVSDTETVLVSVVACRSFVRLFLHAREQQVTPMSETVAISTDFHFARLPSSRLTASTSWNSDADFDARRWDLPRTYGPTTRPISASTALKS